MKSFGVAFLLITLKFELFEAKQFNECDLVRSFYNKTISSKEIYMSLCIGMVIHTTTEPSKTKGKVWWCGEQQAGGECNIKCSSLIDGDLNDVVNCTKTIMSNPEALKVSEEKCKTSYESKVKECLANVDVLESLMNIPIERTTTSTSSLPTTTLNQSNSSDFQTTNNPNDTSSTTEEISTSNSSNLSTTVKPATTTSSVLTTVTSTSNIKDSTTIKPSEIPSPQKAENDSTWRTFWTVGFVLAVVILAVVAFQNRRKIAYRFHRNPEPATNEFENSLLG